ncbi:helix-turn-helix domain-containing protein [Haliscomenobacter sp.]|uniref:helix-turn-helix domain-containing protein n=1 Tax=Haliscomenobacter sp. TaxID=2717303 RepID=UPI003364D03C
MIYYDTPQAAKLMRLAPQTLRKWRHTGNGPCYSKLQGKVVYSQEDILSYIIDRRVNSTAEYRH